MLLLLLLLWLLVLVVVGDVGGGDGCGGVGDDHSTEWNGNVVSLSTEVEK